MKPQIDCAKLIKDGKLQYVVEWYDGCSAIHIDTEYTYDIDAIYNRGVALYGLGRYLESLLYFDIRS